MIFNLLSASPSIVMSAKKSKTLRNYLSVTLSIFASIATACTLLGVAKPTSAYQFPPAGLVSHYVLPLTYLVPLMAVVMPWFISSRRAARLTALSAPLFVVGAFIGYVYLIQRFLIPVPLLPRDLTVDVIVGYQRTALANQQYPGLPDVDVLTRGGFDPPAVDELYTPTSRKIVVAGMLLFYLLMPSGFAVFIGSAYRMDQLSPDEKPPNTGVTQ